MLAFVQQILGYATVEVLEPNWRKLEKKLEGVRTVDQLLRDHVDFLDTVLKECMLTSSKLLRVSVAVYSAVFGSLMPPEGILEDACHLFHICAVLCALHQIGQSGRYRATGGEWRPSVRSYAKTVRLPLLFLSSIS